MSPALPAAGAVLCLLVALRGWAMIRDRGPIDRLDLAEEALAGGEDGRSPLARRLDALAAGLAPRALALLGPRRLARLRHRIDAAGRPRGMTPEVYAGRKAVFAASGAAIALPFALRGSPLMAVSLLVLAVMWDDIALSRTARLRQAAIERGLPDFLDVLAVSVRAGLSFRAGLGRVAEATGGPLADEVTIALRELELGAPRREALEGLRSRNDSEALSAFVTALLQAEELGVPLSDALLDLAVDMRRRSAQEARRRAAKAAPRISLIVTVTIVPAAAILIIASIVVGADVDLGALGV